MPGARTSNVETSKLPRKGFRQKITALFTVSYIIATRDQRCNGSNVPTVQRATPPLAPSIPPSCSPRGVFRLTLDCFPGRYLLHGVATEYPDRAAAETNLDSLLETCPNRTNSDRRIQLLSKYRHVSQCEAVTRGSTRPHNNSRLARSTLRLELFTIYRGKDRAPEPGADGECMPIRVTSGTVNCCCGCRRIFLRTYSTSPNCLTSSVFCSRNPGRDGNEEVVESAVTKFHNFTRVSNVI